MAQHSDKKVVYAALIGNAAIAVMKFVAAVVSGSAAMLAEGFHSAADTGNQLMLLLGHARSKKAPDESHPFGYGKEIYFWAFMVAISIFFVGAALSIYEGIQKLTHPEPVTSILLPLIVLGFSAAFESYPWWIAVSEARRVKRGTGIRSYFDMAVRSKRPTVMVVLFEDTAALLGITIAATGICLARYTGRAIFDALASILIGLLLFAVAVFLARETKALLLGESASKEHRAALRDRLSRIQEIQEVGRLATMHLGPREILVALEIEFVDGLSTDGIETAIDQIERELKDAVPAVTRIYVEAEALSKIPHRGENKRG